MDVERRELKAFLALHASKASTTDTPIAHLHFKSAGELSHDAPLLTLTVDDILEDFDTSSPLVVGMLEQLRTYDPTTQRVVGLVFDDGKYKKVLSEVLWCPEALERRREVTGR